MNRVLTIAALTTLALNASCTVEPDPPMQPPAHILQKQLAAGKTPAVQYRFFNSDSVLFSFDSGLADVAGRVPVSEATTYNGFSVTKTFTALAALQLAERGRIDLNRPAVEYLPGFPYPPTITVRDLLSHSAGIPNPIPLSWIHLQDEHATFDSKHFFHKQFAKHHKIKADPNERFAYSNLGYVLLGQLIEEVTGVSYEQYVTQNILEPLGLSPEDLGFALNTANQAKGYHKRSSLSYWILGLFIDKSKYIADSEQQWKSFRQYYVNGAAYGGLIGTADAFARYVQALLDPSSGLISEEYKRLLFTENVLQGGKASGMCLSWFKGKLDGQVYYAHAGGGGGYYSEVRIYPELGRGSVIMFNRTGFSDERFLDQLDQHLLQAGNEGEIASSAGPQ